MSLPTGSVAGMIALTAQKLQANVVHLTEFGERSTRRLEALDGAADWIASQFRASGCGVFEQHYNAKGVDCRNLEGVFPDFSADHPHLMIGAHYDSAPGTPGADDNASAVAVLLWLVERFAGHAERHRLRFVAFTNEEPPHFRTGTMGSRVFARSCVENGDRIAAMICLESLGVFFDEPGTQVLPVKIPAQLLPPGLDPTVGNFVAIVGNSQSMEIARAFARHFDGRVPGLPIDLPQMEVSDHLSFWDVGIPAIMLTDTAPFRNLHYHLPTDTAEKLDYARLAVTAYATAAALESWLAEKPLRGRRASR